MKKFYIPALLVFTAFNNTVKPEIYDSIKMSFFLTRKKDEWGSDLLSAKSTEALALLKELSEIQKIRNLTIEELQLAYYIFICIFSDIHKNYSTKVSITLNDKDTIRLPFSSEFLLNLMMKIIEEQESQAKAPEKLNA